MINQATDLNKPREPHYGFRDKCYKPIPKKKYRATETYDYEKKKWVKPEEYERPREREVGCPAISKWSDEWSYKATGFRLSKRRLKEYCKRNGKIWENG